MLPRSRSCSRNRARIASLAALLALVAPGARAQTPSAAEDAVALASDGLAYRVDGIQPRYVDAHPDHPELSALLETQVELGEVADGFVGPRAGIPKVRVSLADLRPGHPRTYYASALLAINQGLVAELNRRGLGGVRVSTSPGDIDPLTGQDNRPPGKRAVAVDVQTGRIGDLRVLEVETFCFGERCASGESAGDPIHQRIKQGSPIQPADSAGPGQTDLLRVDALQEYVAALNRHPGRRVVAEISPSRIDPGKAYLDFKIVEDRPWAVYSQGSDTGTRDTQHWRQRTGFRHTQLTGRDDVLRLDWVSDGEWSHVQGLFGSYDFPLGGPESRSTRLQVSGAFSDYDASEVGALGAEFEGRQHVLGAELAHNVFQQNELFADLTLGARWTSVRVEQKLTNIEGHESYWLPRVGARISRETDLSRLFADVGFERSLGTGSGLSERELEKLGRLDVDDRWNRLQYYGRLETYLDPALSGSGSQRRAHEVFLELKGQYSKERLAPQEEQILGGLYSVRGYDQALLAGDTVFTSRAEYKLHLPRLLAARGEPANLPLLGEFRVAPQHPAGRPDWDLSLSLFLDGGFVRQTDRQSYEIEQSVWSWGLGAGFQLLRNLSFQYYLGIAGRDVADPLGIAPDFADRGDAMHHVEFTVMF